MRGSSTRWRWGSTSTAFAEQTSASGHTSSNNSERSASPTCFPIERTICWAISASADANASVSRQYKQPRVAKMFSTALICACTSGFARA
eukprot:5655787-Pleurochrysis_carterae.AAC.2